MNVLTCVKTFGGELDPNFYYFKIKGTWYLNIPGCGLVDLSGHQVTEFKNGLISVESRIVVCNFETKVCKQGTLKKGVWREC